MVVTEKVLVPLVVVLVVIEEVLGVLSVSSGQWRGSSVH